MKVGLREADDKGREWRSWQLFAMQRTSKITVRCTGIETLASHEISCGSNAASCRVAGRGHPRPAPFYEQEVVKAFHDLTHESLARSHRAASVKKRRSGVKILI